MSDSEPIFNVPRAVVLAIALMVGVQIVRDLLPDEADVTFLLTLAFIPARYTGAAPELPGGYLTAFTSFVTYMVVHGGWVHLLVNVAWMLAFGTAVARRIGGPMFFAFSILCGIAGALLHLVFHWGDMAPVVGASAAISGQMAGALRFIFGAKRSPWDQAPDFVNAPLLSLRETFKDRRILLFLVTWVALNVYFGLSAVMVRGAEGNIAWEAHIGGFLCGLFLYGYFDQRRARDAEPPAVSAA
jgi:membrane associated rhomboid family serine protease